MKKLVILFAASALLYSCAKDSPVIPDPNNAPKVSEVPDNFVQKVVIENFTMTSCGQCPKYDLILDSLVRFNNDRVYAMSIHVGDVMEDTSLLTANGRIYYDSLFNPTQVYPSGIVNRHVTSLNDISADQWSSSVFTSLGHVPSCGLALEAEQMGDNALTLKVHVGFNTQLFGQYNLHVFVVQDMISSGDSLYDQLNDFSYEGATPDSNLSLFPLNDTIRQYKHKYVLKRVISEGGPEGDPIPMGAAVAGNDYTVDYVIDLTGIDANNSYILAYVDKYAQSFTGHWIENVQVVRFGETKDWN